MKEAKTMRGLASLAAALLGLTILGPMASASPSLNELIKANQLIAHQIEGALISRNQKEAVNLGTLVVPPQNTQQPYLKETLSQRVNVKLAEKPLPLPEKEKPILLADSTWSKFKSAVKEGGKTAVQPGATTKAAERAAGAVVKENYQKTGDVKANEVQVGPVRVRQEYYPKKK